MSEFRADIETTVAAQIASQVLNPDGSAAFAYVGAFAEARLALPTNFPAALVRYLGYVATETIYIGQNATTNGIATIFVNIQVESSDEKLALGRLGVDGAYALAELTRQKLMGKTPALSGQGPGGVGYIGGIEFREERALDIGNSGMFEIEQRYELPLQLLGSQQ